MSVGAAIVVEGLTKYYGPVIGVEDLSFQVERGEVYGFLGANGAGKTTTMRLLLDLLRPSKGRASVMGVDCHRDSLGCGRRDDRLGPGRSRDQRRQEQRQPAHYPSNGCRKLR